MLYFDLIVFGAKIKIVVASNDDGFRLDCVQCCDKIVSIGWLCANVAKLPGLELAQQVVRVPVEMVLLPILQ